MHYRMLMLFGKSIILTKTAHFPTLFKGGKENIHSQKNIFNTMLKAKCSQIR